MARHDRRETVDSFVSTSVQTSDRKFQRVADRFRPLDRSSTDSGGLQYAAFKSLSILHASSFVKMCRQLRNCRKSMRCRSPGYTAVGNAKRAPGTADVEEEGVHEPSSKRKSEGKIGTSCKFHDHGSAV